MEIVAPIAMVPFFGWGIFTLVRRFRYHEELAPAVEIVTLLGLLLFYAFELVQLREWLHNQALPYLFAMLGLFVAGTALYGHLAVSFLSRLIVDMVAPGEQTAADRPRFGPAEILERKGDFNGAFQEYLVLARIYPGHPEVQTRAAECLLRLSRPDEAASWFRRALARLTAEEKYLAVASRLSDILEHRLHEAGEARRVLEEFLGRYPASDQADAVRGRIDRIGAEVPALAVDTGLQALEEAPLSEPEPFTEKPKRLKSALRETGKEAAPALTPLDTVPISSPDIAPIDAPLTESEGLSPMLEEMPHSDLTLEKLDTLLDGAVEEDNPMKGETKEQGLTSSGLEPM